METFSSAANKIRTELTSSLDDVRHDYTKLFGSDLDRFVDETTKSFLAWQKLNSMPKNNETKTVVSGLVFSAITLHIISMRLLLTGYIVAAGNIQRQVLETIALALLSSCKTLDVCSRFTEDKYSVKNAVRDVLRHADKINANKGALKVLKEARDFYHDYSHPSMATLASHIGFSDEGRSLYVGASFDKGKIEQYQKEFEGRISLAGVIPNFVAGVIANVNSW